MRVSTLSAIMAIPFVAAAAVNSPHPHAAVHPRHQAHVKRSPGIIGELLGINETPSASAVLPPIATSKTTPVVPPTGTGIVTPPTSAASSAASVPSSAASASVVTPPTNNSTVPVIPSNTTHVAPSPSVEPTTTSSQPPPETTQAPPETTEAPSTAPSQDAFTTLVTSTDATGGVLTVFKTVIQSDSSSATGAAQAGKSDGGLSKGATIAIAVIASLVGVGILVAVLLACMRKRRSEDEPMRWPELNRHGDAPAHHAIPVSNHGSSDRRMSLGDELDDPAYLGDVTPNHVPALNGSAFGSTAMLDYDEKAAVPPGALTYDPDYAHHRDLGPQQGYGYDDHHNQGPQQGYGFDDHQSDYTSYPPPVQPQPSPVHGAPYDQWDRSSSDGAHYSAENGYSGMTRQTSPTMATMAGVGAGAMTFPQAQAPSHHHNY